MNKLLTSLFGLATVSIGASVLPIITDGPYAGDVTFPKAHPLETRTKDNKITCRI